MRERSRNDASVEAVMAAAGSGSSRHSTLYLWMRKNHDAFARQLADRGANWIGLTKAFEQKGLLAANGRPATVKVVRQTWRRVQRAAPAKPPTMPTATAPALTPERTVPVAPVRSGILDHEPDEIDRPTYSFDDWKPATLKGMTKPPQAKDKPGNG